MNSRDAFVQTAMELVGADERVVVVIAEISADRFPPHERVVNVGIREQLLVSVAGGLALDGRIPIVHTYAPFLVERAFEQVKLDLSHQDVPAVLVSVGASYDSAASGRTHHCPGDVALLDTLPGWTAHVIGHRDEVGPLLRAAVASGDRTYIRLAADHNAAPGPTDGRMRVVRHGSDGTVIAVGPMLDRVVAATDGLDVTVLHAVTVRPFDATTLRAVHTGLDVAIVEPYLEGTSSAVVSAALADVPHRLHAVGVPNRDLRRYGRTAEHDAAHGLDAAGLAARHARFGQPTSISVTMPSS